MTYVVVTLTASECDKDPGTRCLMDVVGPFATYREAVAELATWPAWTTPHVMQLHLPGNDQPPQAQLVITLDLP